MLKAVDLNIHTWLWPITLTGLRQMSGKESELFCVQGQGGCKTTSFLPLCWSVFMGSHMMLTSLDEYKFTHWIRGGIWFHKIVGKSLAGIWTDIYTYHVSITNPVSKIIFIPFIVHSIGCTIFCRGCPNVKRGSLYSIYYTQSIP